MLQTVNLKCTCIYKYKSPWKLKLPGDQPPPPHPSWDCGKDSMVSVTHCPFILLMCVYDSQNCYVLMLGLYDYDNFVLILPYTGLHFFIIDCNFGTPGNQAIAFARASKAKGMLETVLKYI